MAVNVSCVSIKQHFQFHQDVGMDKIMSSRFRESFLFITGREVTLNFFLSHWRGRGEDDRNSSITNGQSERGVAEEVRVGR